jgi:uncharacterized membrane protein YgdD (TMEM256/DUF423 family)
MNSRNTLLAGAVLGLLGVAFGAFGAHALKALLTASGRIETFELAVRYQFYHAFALLAAGIIQHLSPVQLLRYSTLVFLSGTILFSGSLYVVCFSGITAFAMVTPVGGVLLMAGWTLLIVGVAKGIKTKSHPG